MQSGTTFVPKAASASTATSSRGLSNSRSLSQSRLLPGCEGLPGPDWRRAAAQHQSMQGVLAPKRAPPAPPFSEADTPPLSPGRTKAGAPRYNMVPKPCPLAPPVQQRLQACAPSTVSKTWAAPAEQSSRTPPWRAAPAPRGQVVQTATAAASSTAAPKETASPGPMGSLLAAYGESGSEEEPTADAPPEPAAESAFAVTPAAWELWSDMLQPRCRHGLVVGKSLAELLAGWSACREDYPPDPLGPHGSCSSTSCADGTRVPEEGEKRKRWLEDDEWKGRCKDAARALEAFSGRAFVTKRGQNSKQHFLEVNASAAEVRSTDAACAVRQHLATIARQAALAMRRLLHRLPAAAAQSQHLEVPVACLLAAEGVDYLPLQASVPASSSGSPVQLSLQHRGAQPVVRVAPLHRVAAPGEVVHVEVRLPEGKAELKVCCFQPHWPQADPELAASLGKVAVAVSELPAAWRLRFEEPLSAVWDGLQSKPLLKAETAGMLEALEELWRSASGTPQALPSARMLAGHAVAAPRAATYANPKAAVGRIPDRQFLSISAARAPPWKAGQEESASKRRMVAKQFPQLPPMR